MGISQDSKGRKIDYANNSMKYLQFAITRHYERLDLEICGRLPFSEYLKYPLLGILVLHRRALRAFEPDDHVLHWHVPPLSTRFILSPFLVLSTFRVIICQFRVQDISIEVDYFCYNDNLRKSLKEQVVILSYSRDRHKDDVLLRISLSMTMYHLTRWNLSRNKGDGWLRTSADTLTFNEMKPSYGPKETSSI